MTTGASAGTRVAVGAALAVLLAGCGAATHSTTAPSALRPTSGIRPLLSTGTSSTTPASPATASPSSASASSPSAPSVSAPVRSVAASPTTSAVAPTVPPTSAPAVEQAGWTVISRTPEAIVSDEESVTEPDGSHVVIARFRAGTFRVDLHVGSTDPPAGSATIPTGSGDIVSSTERPALLGAFNGGFKTSTGAGGVEIDGQVLTPLLAGAASIEIDAAGQPTLGLWGGNLPVPGTAATAISVRQNLLPLVEDGAPSAAIGEVSAWGLTLGGVSSIARSALGQDAAGDLVYAGSMSALPSDLADALVGAGARTAMELDINPFWVQLDMATTPGGPLTAQIPGQSQVADQYLNGWTRDFFAIVAST